MLNRFVMLVAILGLSFTGQTYTSERDRDWLPAGVHVEAVGRDMLINGLPTDVLRLHGAANAQLLRDAFLAQDATHALPQAHVDGWELHARPVAGGLQTLQLRTLAGGDVEAIFATTDLSRGAARATADAPLRLAADARITSVVESNDKNLRGTQYVAWSKLPPGHLRQRLCLRARTLGWQVRDCEAAAIEMSRSTSALVVTVVATASSSGGVSGLRSVVVMNHMQSEQ